MSNPFRACGRLRAAGARGADGLGPGALVETLERRELLAVTPNDPLFGRQWGLRAVRAPDAWGLTKGMGSLIVGHVDTGIDYAHADLYKNVWINNAEIPPIVGRTLRDPDRDGKITFWDLNDSTNAGKVADVNRNGYVDAGDLLAPWKPDRTGGWADGVNGKNWRGDTFVDDLVGWDFADNDNNPLDANGHGTHTAGTLGAIGNNGRGVTGVLWKTRMMALKVFGGGDNSGSFGVIAKAVRYAADNGARVSNNSYGGTGGYAGDELYQAIKYAKYKNHLCVVAAGNDGSNNDTSSGRSYPASYDLSNIISVEATTNTGSRASFSNYGKVTVDLGAPGAGVYSTWKGGGYANLSGTSAAAPFVTGTIALMLSRNPALSNDKIKSTLLASADRSGLLADTSVTGGRLNTYRAVAATPRSLLTTAATTATSTLDQ